MPRRRRPRGEAVADRERHRSEDPARAQAGHGRRGQGRLRRVPVADAGRRIAMQHAAAGDVGDDEVVHIGKAVDKRHANRKQEFIVPSVAHDLYVLARLWKMLLKLR